MEASHITILLLAFPIILVSCLPQEITFYKEADQRGDGIIIRASNNDLSSYSGITNSTGSYCVVGAWRTWALKDFFGSTANQFGSFMDEARFCENFESGHMGSIRHFGALDTGTPALHFYEFPRIEGREFILTGAASTNFPFLPKSFVSSGKTSWTFFEGVNFDGVSTCKQAGAFNMTYEATIGNVGSVIKGCGTEAQRNIALHKLGLLH